MSGKTGFDTTFTALFELLPDAVCLQASDGTIVDCNSAATNLTGYSREELLKLRFSNIFPGDDLPAQTAAMLSSESSESSFLLDCMCRKRDGAEIPVSVDLRRFLTDGDTFIFMTVRDLTAQKKTEDELKRLDQQLRQSQKMDIIGQLAGGITHYYNNIFTGIIGTLDMAKRDASSDILPLLKRAQKVANLASGFTRRLLTFARESDEALEPTDIGELICDVEDFAKITFDRQISITVDSPTDLNAVIADPASLHHLLLNLMVNARDTLLEKERSVTWDPELSIHVAASNVTVDSADESGRSGAKKGRFVRVSVTDTGCGIDEKKRKLVFDPFFTTKEAGKGTGLGLATALSTVEQCGGWIELETEPGKGSTFTIYLPSVTLKKAVTSQSDTKDIPTGTETVLIVDDDEMIRTLGIMTLERQGYTVFGAVDGESGLAEFMKKKDSIDLVILDLLLPGMPGGKLLEKIRRMTAEIPVIVTSGHDFESDRGSFKELRADDYIMKPFNISDLAFAVRNVLDRKRKSIT